MRLKKNVVFMIANCFNVIEDDSMKDKGGPQIAGRLLRTILLLYYFLHPYQLTSIQDLNEIHARWQHGY